MSTNEYEAIIKTVIKAQEAIIGPLALDIANQISGVKVYPGISVIEIKGDAEEILTKLVEKYGEIFGQASIETCKDAMAKVKPELKESDVPDILKTSAS